MRVYTCGREPPGGRKDLLILEESRRERGPYRTTRVSSGQGQTGAGSVSVELGVNSRRVRGDGSVPEPMRRQVAGPNLAEPRSVTRRFVRWQGEVHVEIRSEPQFHS